MRGCGPRYDGNSVGGEMYWAAALHVYTPLPFRPGRNSFGDLFRLHGFINGGNLSTFTFTYGKPSNSIDYFSLEINLLSNLLPNCLTSNFDYIIILNVI